jgi:hypothetical protein
LAVVSGTGMSNCTSYSFGIAGSTSLTPLNYGNQYFQCSGVNKDDISFNQQGNGWRVQKSLFSYIPNTSCSYATLDGVDGWNATINTVTISPNDVVLPCCYQVSNGVNCVQFTINGTTQPGIYDRSNWVIWTY